MRVEERVNLETKVRKKIKEMFSGDEEAMQRWLASSKEYLNGFCPEKVLKHRDVRLMRVLLGQVKKIAMQAKLIQETYQTEQVDRDF